MPRAEAAGPAGCVLLHGAATRPMLLLWGYLAYWVVIVVAKAPDTEGTIWLTAAIISAIVGTGINAGAIGSTPVLQYVTTGEWDVVLCP